MVIPLAAHSSAATSESTNRTQEGLIEPPFFESLGGAEPPKPPVALLQVAQAPSLHASRPEKAGSSPNPSFHSHVLAQEGGNIEILAFDNRRLAFFETTAGDRLELHHFLPRLTVFLFLRRWWFDWWLLGSRLRLGLSPNDWLPLF